MGVPKFFRWISERYPCLGEIIKDYQVPEFDNLYLDMNGIFHVCSHPDDDNAHFRITEEDIFKNIFHYIEVLFRKIKPQKVFFMAVDGVAPRAKLNQQRGRRFRTAKLAEDAIKKAETTGEKLPSEAPFDSNCITPGTEFMTKLDEQLKYFITKKISTDSLWQKCKVIYSGHKTPGEGEHKIMDYIRFCRSQEEYDPNTRHCLYGLDADLIMLGLTSHEPHFSLLREEIIYGRKVKRIQTPEEINFYLFHLSLLREYLHLEFASLHNIHFGYDVESVVDDVVLLGFLVGNDFIPNLPELHINKEGLSLLFSTYKRCLPQLDGYINEKGTLNFKRFEVFMQFLSEVEIDKFRDINDDQKYLASKRKKRDADERAANLESFDFDNTGNGLDTFCSIQPEQGVSDEQVRNTFEKFGLDQPDQFSDSEENSLPEDEQIFRSEFRQHKRNYYRTKFNFERVSDDVMKDIAVQYVRGIQWILNYYFNGICSWSWFYPFHYSPYISDVTNFSDVEITFEMSTAFLPYEQLLAVLPPYSVCLVPRCFHHLMTRRDSALQDFYPQEFQTDLNGKVQEWEAVVLIPFIDENRLIDAMLPCNCNLTEEEKERNKHGPQFVYTYNEESLGIYRAPDYFCTVTANHSSVIEEPKDAWFLIKSKVFKGLHPGVDLNMHFNGFPTLRHLAHNFRISREDVKVFQHSSRNESIILQVTPMEQKELSDVAANVLDKIIYVSWPHLTEAKVVAVSDGERKYQFIDEGLTSVELNKQEVQFWHSERKDLSENLLRRWGIDGGTTQILVHCKTLCGLRYICTREGKISLEKQWSTLLSTYPWQLTVTDIRAYNPCYKTYDNIHEMFPIGTKVFMLGNPYYGSMGTVNKLPENGRIRVEMVKYEEPVFSNAMDQFYNVQDSYMAANVAASRLSISTSIFAQITGNILVSPAARLQPFQKDQKFVNKTNIGMNLKNNSKGEEVKGFTRKDNSIWLYSELCVKSVENYYNDFPEVFQFISNGGGSRNTIYQDEIFEEDWQENFKRLKSYLEKATFYKAERKKCSSVTIDESTLILAEDEIKKYSRIAAKLTNMQIRPHLLFLPSSLQGSSPPDVTSTFEILDRVVNVREGFSVPLGARGTIIGINPTKKETDTLYDVMFDEEFIGGNALLGSISAARCCRMYWSALINLSHGERKTGTVRSRKRTNGNTPWSNTANQKEFHHEYGTRNNWNAKPQRRQSPDNWRNTGTGTGFQVQSYGNKGPSQAPPRTPPHLPKPAASAEEKSPSAPAPSSLPPPGLFALKTILPILPERKHSARVTFQEPQQRSVMAGNNNQNWGSAKQDIRELTSPEKESQEADGNLPPGSPDLQTSHPKVLQNSLVPDADVLKLPFVIHGSEQHRWSDIQREGLRNDNNYVMCITYRSDAYQLLIYLDVKRLLADGYHFRQFFPKELHCSTNDKNVIPVKYIEKVYENSKDRLIYVSPTCTNSSANLPHINRTTRMKGRGQGMKELREYQDLHDTHAIGRRIRKEMRGLKTIFGEGSELSMINPLQFYSSLNPSMIPPPPPENYTKYWKPQFDDNSSDQEVSNKPIIDLGEEAFPTLSKSTGGAVTDEQQKLHSWSEKCKDSPSKSWVSQNASDQQDLNFPTIQNNIFVPTQVARSTATARHAPPKDPEASSSSPPAAAAESYAIRAEPPPKQISPSTTDEKTKVAPRKQRRNRLAANLGRMKEDTS